MQINAIIEQPSSADERRDGARWRIRLEVTGSLDSEQANVVIHDISTAGMLIETSSSLHVGQAIAVSLSEDENVAAHIVWGNEPLFGCRFDQPLSQASVSAVRLRNPAPTEFKRDDEAAQAKSPERLSDRLRRLRRERGISRTALSHRTGISKTTLWSWETGKTTPRHTNILILADAFGMSDQQLLLGEGASYVPTRPARDEYASNPLPVVIDQAKEVIARAAGVDKSQVNVRIDF